ncbi:PREDICTED: proteasome subunit beta type-5-B isoform X2 [Prunus dulcis]|uniref:PREDICTED: proteasome subunit beta type-5-B isoform X2 n=1 Tax=Prunus dulcis TaxID=3755 RepID=A0A5E4ET91_PRUDU|nr:PREDICTED: proteasome subunit beta type-5-B isoform X2 [Prunus dulcis]
MGMTEAYSMIIKKLQNVVSEHAYLEKPKEKLKVEGWGTTNIAIICGQEIFVGVDTRGTSGDKKGFIENEEATKLCLINYCNILVAMAGDSAQSVEVLMDVNKELRNAMQTNGAVDDNIHLAANKAREYIGKWESEYGKEFQGSIVLAGFEKKDGSFYPHTYVVRSSRFVHTSNDNDAILNGSGGAHIWDYFLTWRPEYIEGVLEKMKRALLYASLFDEMSGGFLRVVKLTQSSFNTEYYKSVLEALFDHCDEFAACLSHSLIFLWYRRDQGYTHEFNVLVDGVFKEKLLGYNYNVVIGLKGTFVVRLVHFHRSICDEPYEEVRRKHEVFAQNRHMRPQHLDDHDVPSQVQVLPWIIIDELGTSPILFGKANT